jgi:hypothetical protein
MSVVARVTTVGLFSLFIILSGVWLSRAGRPLNVGISTLHKLLGLGMGIYLLVTVVQRAQLVPLTSVEWIAVVVTGLLFLALVATGGFLASDKPMPVAVLRVHQVFPALAVVSAGGALFPLLAG